MLPERGMSGSPVCFPDPQIQNHSHKKQNTVQGAGSRLRNISVQLPSVSRQMGRNRNQTQHQWGNQYVFQKCLFFVLPKWETPGVIFTAHTHCCPYEILRSRTNSWCKVLISRLFGTCNVKLFPKFAMQWSAACKVHLGWWSRISLHLAGQNWP